jgi:hypothetical protein
MLRLTIIASGKAYQDAAAWGAPTYLVHTERPDLVTVLVPEQESPSDLLIRHADKYGYTIEKFPLRIVIEQKYTSQLKCQGFCHAVSKIINEDLLLLVDADTCSMRPLNFSQETRAGVLSGKIGLAPNRIDFNRGVNPAKPWYLRPDERTTYVNSGVILASRGSLDMFECFSHLSGRPDFLRGRFNDQKVINFALGKYYKDRLWLLDRAYNTKDQLLSDETIICHYLGGAGSLGAQPRKEAHEKMCARLLNESPSKSALLEKKSSFPVGY